MPLETLTGPDIPRLLSQARRRVGADAVVVSVRRVAGASGTVFEMVAADPRTAALVKTAPTSRRRVVAVPARMAFSSVARTPARSSPAAKPAVPAASSATKPSLPAPAVQASHWPLNLKTAAPDPAPRSTGAPLTIALVGPTGAGKTTTIAKLANHPRVFGARRVGLICLDTYRVGAVEQSRIYADLAGLPLEVVYEPADVARAMRRLRDCDVLLIDTAGRGPRGQGDTVRTRGHLEALAPDETHLVLPAGLQAGLARRVVEHHLSLGITHVLPTKLDECPEDLVALEAAAAFGLPVRWYANGQRVPRDLESAAAEAATGGAAHAVVEVA